MSNEYVIATKNPAIQDFLWEIGVRGDVRQRVTRDDVWGRTVIGTLPLYLAVYARQMIVPVFRGDPEKPGQPRTLDAARERFVGFQSYRVSYERLPDDLLAIQRELGVHGGGHHDD